MLVQLQTVIIYLVFHYYSTNLLCLLSFPLSRKPIRKSEFLSLVVLMPCPGVLVFLLSLGGNKSWDFLHFKHFTKTLFSTEDASSSDEELKQINRELSSKKFTSQLNSMTSGRTAGGGNRHLLGMITYIRRKLKVNSVFLYYCWWASRKNPKFCVLRSRLLLGISEVTFMCTWPWYQFARGNLTHAATARKAISTMFSSMEKICVEIHLSRRQRNIHIDKF